MSVNDDRYDDNPRGFENDCEGSMTGDDEDSENVVSVIESDRAVDVRIRMCVMFTVHEVNQ